MDILVGIDGTGPRDPFVYSRNFRNSFVSRVMRGGPRRVQRYFEGPSDNWYDGHSGGELYYIMGAARRFLRAALEQYGASADTRVLLTGYSRGAAGVVHLAQWLQENDILVHAMMLFDCVDRYPLADTSVVPANVRVTRHVMRDIARSWSRESFGHSAMHAEPRDPNAFGGIEALESEAFIGTHGAIGGVPWLCDPDRRWNCHPPPRALINEQLYDGGTRITFERDQACAHEVWDNVQPFLREQGFLLSRGSE